MVDWIGGYPIDRRLGTGGFGTVYAATHPVTGQQVAIKTFDRTTGSQAELWTQLEREAAALRAVQSPHCLQVFDVVRTESVTALVTDYVDGVAMSDLLGDRGPLEGPAALTVLWEAAQGLAAVHAAGLMHGDVKPANIMVDGSGTSRLIDFGLATLPGYVAADELAPWGSQAYASPEQVEHGYRDHLSDIYSLTVTLYELLCGQRPFTGDTPEEVRHRQVHQQLPDPRLQVPDLGDGLTQLLYWGTAKDPDQRPQDVATFLTHLQDAAISRYGTDWQVPAAVATVASPLLAAGALASGTLSASGAAVTTAGSASMGAGSTGVADASTATTAGSGLISTGAAKILAVVVTTAIVGAGLMAFAIVKGSGDGPAGANHANDLYAYATDQPGTSTPGSHTTLTVMNGTTRIARLPDSSPPSWSRDGRYVAVSSGGELTVIDTTDHSIDTRNCPGSDGCVSAAIWNDQVATISGGTILTYRLEDLDEDQPHELAAAPHGVVWDRLIGTGDSLVATGSDEDEIGYRGVPIAVGHRVTSDGSVTRFDEPLSVAYWETAAYHPQSAYDGPRAALAHAGSGGACVNQSSVALIDPTDPTADPVDTDTSAMLVGANDQSDPDGPITQESQVLTGLWFDPQGMLHASSATHVCESYGLGGVENLRVGVPQQIWRLEGTTWVADDDRPLMSAHVLPSGARLELARKTYRDGYTIRGDLALVGQGVIRVDEHVAAVYTPGLPTTDPVPVPEPPEVVELDDAGIDGSGDTSQIAALAQDFRRYIGTSAKSLYEQARQDGYTSSDCDAQSNWIAVDTFDPRGFAHGRVGSCGGYAAIWAKKNGVWTEADGTQESWDCTSLIEHDVPARLIADSEGAATCYDYDSDSARVYYNYGSPAATASAAGAKSGSGSDDGPGYATPCGSEPVFTPVEVESATEGVTITYEVSAVCNGGQWLNWSQLRVPLMVDGETWADGHFDYSGNPRWIPETGRTLRLTYPYGNISVPADDISTAVAADLRMDEDDRLIVVPCEPGPDNTDDAPVPAQAATDDTGPAVTASGDTAGSDDDRQESALEALQRIAAEDHDDVAALEWTAQLSSKRPGTRDDGIVYDTYDDILALHLAHRAKYPNALLAWSNDWPGSYGPSSQDYWVTLSGTSESTTRPVLRWCRAEGWSDGDCWAKKLRTSGDPDQSTDKPPADPSKN